LLLANHGAPIDSLAAGEHEPRQPAIQTPKSNPVVRTDAYGDLLPSGALARMGTLRDFIGEGSSQVIFSPDGKLVTASSGFIRPSLRFWDTASGRVAREFEELDRLGIRAGYVAISGDGKRLAVANGYSEASVWVGDFATGRRLRVFGDFYYFWGIALSFDGNILLVNEVNGPSLWDISTGKQTQWPSLAGYRPVAFVHEFEVVGLRRRGGEATLRFGVSGHEIHSRSTRGLYHGLPRPIAVSPERRLMASFGRNQTVNVWNLVNGRPMRALPSYRVPPGLIIENLERQLAFSPDGKLLAAGDTLTSLALWDIATGRLYRRFGGIAIEMGFAFAPDGKRLVTGGKRFRYWDIPRGQEIHRYPDQPAVAAVAFTPDGKSLVTVAGLQLRLWDSATGREIPRFQAPHRFRELLYPRRGDMGEEDRRFPGTKPSLRSVAVAPDGLTIATGAEDGSLWLWNVANGQAIREIADLDGAVESIAFAPDGKTFAAADEAGIYLADT